MSSLPVGPPPDGGRRWGKYCSLRPSSSNVLQSRVAAHRLVLCRDSAAGAFSTRGFMGTALTRVQSGLYVVVGAVVPVRAFLVEPVVAVAEVAEAEACGPG